MPSPDVPVSTTHWPGSAAKLTSRSTGSLSPPSRCMVKVLATSLSSSAGIGVSRVVKHSAHSRESGKPVLKDAHSANEAQGPRLRGDEREFVAGVRHSHTGKIDDTRS